MKYGFEFTYLTISDSRVSVNIMVRNLTVALDEESYRAAKISAAERGVSVSALVRDYFKNLQPVTQKRKDHVDLLFSTMNLVRGHSAHNRERNRSRLFER